MRTFRFMSSVLFVLFLVGCSRVSVNTRSSISEKDIHGILVKMKTADRDTRQKYINQIVKKGGNAVPTLISELKDPDPEIQESAAALLGIINDKRAVDPLIDALNGGIKRKYIAAWSLSKLRDEKSIPALIKSLEDDNFEVRKYSIRALISIGQPAVDSLINVVHHQNPYVRAGASRALGEISNVKAVEPLLSIINDKDENVIVSVTWAIGKIGDHRAVAPLIKLLYHKNKLIRINSARSLGIIGGKDAQADLEKVLVEDKEFVVREWAARALENITGKRYKYLDSKGIMVEPYNLYR